MAKDPPLVGEVLSLQVGFDSREGPGTLQAAFALEKPAGPWNEIPQVLAVYPPPHVQPVPAEAPLGAQARTAYPQLQLLQLGITGGGLPLAPQGHLPPSEVPGNL